MLCTLFYILHDCKLSEKYKIACYVHNSCQFSIAANVKFTGTGFNYVCFRNQVGSKQNNITLRGLKIAASHNGG